MACINYVKGVDKCQCLEVLLAIAITGCSFLVNVKHSTSKANYFEGASAPPSTHLSTAM